MIDKNTISLLLPEIIVAITAVIVIVGGVFAKNRSIWTFVSAGGCALALVALFLQRSLLESVAVVESGPIFLDSLGVTMRWLTFGLAFLFILALNRTALQSQTTEFLGLVLLVFVGLSLACIAGNLVLLFLALELISVPTYVLLFLGGGDKSSAESTAKYFFLSILSSAMFLLGLSLLFGVSGSSSLSGMRAFFEGAGVGGGVAAPLVMVATVMIFAGLGFKIAAVPFHFYAPDVYQMTTNGNAGLLAVVPKIAGIVVLLRFLVVLLPAQLTFGWQAILALSLLTMTIGNVCALWQNNIRRMMAYSSIAHAGYMLIGVAVGLAVSGAEGESVVYGGFSATLLYLVIYAIASLGTFAVLCEVATDAKGQPLDRVDQLAGMSKRHPWMAGVLAICMFSLSGIPPLAGFWGKMTLFTGALNTSRATESLSSGGPWFLILAIVGALNAAIAAAYYLRIIGVSYFVAADTDETDKDSSGATSSVGTAAISAFICALVLIAAGILPRFAVERFDAVGASLTSALAASPNPDGTGEAAEKVAFRD